MENRYMPLVGRSRASPHYLRPSISVRLIGHFHLLSGLSSSSQEAIRCTSYLSEQIPSSPVESGGHIPTSTVHSCQSRTNSPLRAILRTGTCSSSIVPFLRSGVVRLSR